MLYNKRADSGCIYGCCSEFGKDGGLSNRKHRRQAQGILRTREKREWLAEYFRGKYNEEMDAMPPGIVGMMNALLNTTEEDN